MSHTSFMEKLLDGVEVKWITLGNENFIEVANKGRKPVKASLRTSGNIPYYGANNIQDYVEGYTHEGNFVLIAEDGSSSLKNYSIQYTEGKFWANNHVHVVRGKSGVNTRFIYHYLSTVNFIPYLTGGGRAKLTKGKMLEIAIPIPPPEVQTEIVSILDTFTELTAELTAEFTAEFHARKKQYSYYRDKLLSFEEGEVEWKRLGEVVKINTGQKPPEILDRETIFDYINAGTSRSGYSKSSNCEGDTITTPSRGQGGIGYVGFQNKPFWLGPLCYKMKSLDKTLLINKLLYYFLQSRSELLLGLKKEGGVPAVNKSDLAKLKIPIPPLKKQKEIVAILDKFDTLVNSISEGLPKEIELRQQQYEYYRELLLSFPKKEVEA